jgi:hypothetical protein
MARPKNSSLFKDIKITDWITAFGALIGVFAGIWVISQNSATIKTANDALRISQAPTLNIEFPGIEKPQNFRIQNTGSVNIISIEAYAVCYSISTDELREITHRDQSASLIQPAYSKLESGDRFDLSASVIMEKCTIPMPLDTKSNRLFALIIAFHRETDNKRFVHIEPFGGAFENGDALAIPAYASSKAGSFGGSSISGYVTSLTKIEEMEKTFFRVEQ